MTYRKQTWRDYDDTKTEIQNLNNGAVVTPERMNHIETGIANSANKEEVAAQLAQTEKKLGSYSIELNKFNIQPGLIGHKSPYSKSEYDQGYNNYEGIRNALNYASEQGFTEVVLPKNDYVICYQDPIGQDTYATWNNGWEIAIPSNMTLDLGGSCISVMYDSLNRNPYDKGTLPTWNLAGRIFGFKGSHNSHIKNGELKGDRYERSYTNSNERQMEQTYGIYISEGSKFCTVDNMKIHGFMGDSISGNSGHNPLDGSAINAEDVDFSPGYIKEGVLTDLDGAYSTDFLSLDKLNTREIALRGRGYTRVPNFVRDSSEVSWFDINNVFISSEPIRALENIYIPDKARYLRLSIFNEEIGLPSITKRFTIGPLHSHNFKVSHCEIYNNNRGGISNMVDDTIIEKCKIYNNGLGGKEGWPRFPDTTRYAINVEDTTVKNITIRDNRIYDAFNCILLSALSFTVENNHFFNVKLTAIHVYSRVDNGVIKNNKFYNCEKMLSSTDSENVRDIILSDNIAVDSDSFKMEGSNTRLIASNNITKNRRINAVLTKGVASNLVIDETPSITSQYSLNTIKGTFRDSEINLDQPQYSTSATIVTTSKESKNFIINCEDKDRRITPDKEIHEMTLNGGRVFKNIRNSTGTLLFKNCTFNSINDLRFECYTNTETSDWDITFEDCDFTFLGGANNSIFTLPTGGPGEASTNIKINMKRCKLSIGAEFTNNLTIFQVLHLEDNQFVTINLTDVILDTSKASVTVELCKRLIPAVNPVIINTKNLQVEGELTQSLNGYTIVPV